MGYDQAAGEEGSRTVPWIWRKGRPTAVCQVWGSLSTRLLIWSRIFVLVPAKASEHAEATEQWLDYHGFPYESVCYNKPRINDGEEYCWVDNKPVMAIYLPEGLR